MSAAPGSIVVIGAGPAGLTAARELARQDRDVTVVEAEAAVGGLSRTVERDGWRFDIGGHRFFSRSAEVRRIWDEILGAEDFLERRRLSRIYYDGRYFDYPLNPGNVFRQVGLVEATRCLASFAWARIAPPQNQDHFEGWVSARFGRRLYEKFFRAYTEKVWGVPPDRIDADWAAQRIKGMSLADAARLTRRGREGKAVTSLINSFHYPRLGPGMMWEACREQAEHAGAEIVTGARVERVLRRAGRARAVVARAGGALEQISADAVISSMPLGHLVEAMDPAAPADVRLAARGLRHRDFLTVALVVPRDHAFPDNWIYVHSPGVQVGRIQNYRAWSPDMARAGSASSCLGLEYFVSSSDELWTMADADLVALAASELDRLGIAPARAGGGRLRRAHAPGIPALRRRLPRPGSRPSGGGSSARCRT